MKQTGIGSRATAGALGLVLALGGCASESLEVNRQGALPPSAAGLGLSAEDAAHEPPALASALDRRMGQLGWAPGGGHPAYRLESAYSEHDGGVGAYDHTAAKDEPVWLAKPASIPWWLWRRHPRMRELSVRILDASGKEVYRARVVERLDGAAGAPWERLAEAAIDRPAP